MQDPTLCVNRGNLSPGTLNFDDKIAHKYTINLYRVGKRLHARVIIRDGRDAFFGSQSLRTAELDSRREVGLIVKNPKVLKAIMATFEKDWAETKVAKVEAKVEAKEAKQAEAAAEPATASA